MYNVYTQTGYLCASKDAAGYETGQKINCFYCSWVTDHSVYGNCGVSNTAFAFAATDEIMYTVWLRPLDELKVMP